MHVLKKAAAVLVMILSALLVLVMLAGIVGAWWGQGQLRGIVSDVATTLDRTLERSQSAVDQINKLVVASQGRVDEVSANVTNAGAKIEETNLALVAMEKLFEQDLTPTVERITERAADTRDTLALAERTIRLMQLLPGSSDNQLLILADQVLQKIRDLDQAVQDTRASIQDAKSQVTTEAVGRLTAPLGAVSAALGGVSSDLAATSQRIDERQAQLVAFRDRLLLAVTLAAVVLTLALLWMALAQLGLFVHAYGIFTGRDPLAKWHKGAASAGTPAPLPQPGGGAA